MKTLISIALVSLLFTTVGCERISWEIYSYQTKERCTKVIGELFKTVKGAKVESITDVCYQNRMELYEQDGTKLDTDGDRIPMERRYPD